MVEALETLMHEHRLIEQVAGSLDTFVVNMARQAEADRQTVREYADFFRTFTDKCHHGKEEDRLFVLMNQFGFPREFGPVAVMIAEHREGRDHIAVLASIGAGDGPLTDDERQAVIEHGGAYVPLIRAHIMKEDNILYPMAQQAIPPEEMDKLAAAMELFERDEMGEGTHERYHALAERLIEAYPPDASRMAEGAACVGCPGHM